MRSAWQLSVDEGASDDDTGEADAAGTAASSAGPAASGEPDAAAEPDSLEASARRIDPEQVRRLRLRMIKAERDALLDARDEGRFSAASLGAALEGLDAEQISLEVRGGEF